MGSTASIYLLVAVVTEVIATSCLKASDGFTKVQPSVFVIVGYSISFYCLSLALRVIPLGIAYAIWAGLGTVFIAIVGVVVYKHTPDVPAVAGMTLIVLGVVVIHLFSEAAVH
ncbi:MAG: multidrug efflux SMR transporter [Myxococcota bacterium]